LVLFACFYFQLVKEEYASGKGKVKEKAGPKDNESVKETAGSKAAPPQKGVEAAKKKPEETPATAGESKEKASGEK